MARIFGTDGNDTLLGWLRSPLKADADTNLWSGQADLIDAKAGNDSIDGGDGADRLIGGAGKDTILGGKGSDTILPAGGTFLFQVEGNVIEGGSGKDWVSYEDERVESVILALDDSFSYDVIRDVENLRGGGAADRLTGDEHNNQLEGMGGRDTIFGGKGRDTLRGGDEALLGDDLHGGAGDDSIDGGRGFDLITGDVGADYLFGGDGGDIIDGGRGADTIRGGAGADTLDSGQGYDAYYYANAAEGGDLLLEYRAAVDRILISASGFGGGLVAGQNVKATGAYIESATGTATSAAGVGQFIYDADFGVLSWDADGAGGAAAVMLFEFAIPVRWTASEIVII